MGAGRAKSRSAGGAGGDYNIGDGKNSQGYSEYAISDEEYAYIKDLEERLYQEAVDQDTLDEAVDELRRLGIVVNLDRLPLKPNGQREVIDQEEVKPKNPATVSKHLDKMFGDILDSDMSDRQKVIACLRRISKIENYVNYQIGEKPTAEEMRFYRYVLGGLSQRQYSVVLDDYLNGRPVGSSLPVLLTGRPQTSHIEVIDNSAYNASVRANAAVAAQFMGTLLTAVRGYDKDVPLKLEELSFEGVTGRKELGNYRGLMTSFLPDGTMQTGAGITLTGTLTITDTAKNTGWHPTTDRSRSVLSHEFGHYLQDVIYTKGSNGGLPSSVTSSDRFKFFSSGDVQMQYEQSGNPLRSTLTQGVSGYAQRNYREAFAEATSAYIMGVTPTQGKEYYKEYKAFMSEVGLAHLEGLGRK